MWLIMNKMNMKFHEICAVVKEISVHNGNIHVHQAPFSNDTASNNKRAKMALDRLPEFWRLPGHFFVPFREEFTSISLYSASSPHSLIPCLLTDQNFPNKF